MAQARRFLMSSSLSRALTGNNNSINSYRVCQPQATLAPVFSLKRFFSEAKLFIGGLSFRTTEDSLRDCFAEHGEVSDVRIIMDRETGRSRGFGFVTFYNDSDAEAAMSKKQGFNLDGRVIRVDKASARAPPPRSSMGMGSSNFSNEEPEAPVAEDWGSLPNLDANVSGPGSSANESNNFKF